MEKQFKLLFFGLLLIVFLLFVPNIIITPATQLLVLMEAVFAIYLYPPVVIFNGFFGILSKQKKSYSWRLSEVLMVIFVTIYIFVYLYRGLYKGIMSLQSMIMEIIFFFLVVSSLVGLIIFGNDFVKKKPDRRSYIILLISTVIAANTNILMLNTADTAGSFVGTLPILWRLLPLLIFTIPSFIVIIRQFYGRSAKTRATFLIWSGLGSMLTVAMIYLNSIGLYYIPIYLFLAAAAFIIEFLPKNLPVGENIVGARRASPRK